MSMNIRNGIEFYENCENAQMNMNDDIDHFFQKDHIFSFYDGMSPIDFEREKPLMNINNMDLTLYTGNPKSYPSEENELFCSPRRGESIKEIGSESGAHLPEEEVSSELRPNASSYIEQNPEQEDEKALECLSGAERKLAVRNIKLNFGTALVQFAEFRAKKERKNLKRSEEMEELVEWLKTEQHNFRSFDGWRYMWKHQEFGSRLRKMSKMFFSKTYVKTYVLFSRVTEKYKPLYRSKIEKFLNGARNPDSFTPHNF